MSAPVCLEMRSRCDNPPLNRTENPLKRRVRRQIAAKHVTTPQLEAAAPSASTPKRRSSPKVAPARRKPSAESSVNSAQRNPRAHQAGKKSSNSIGAGRRPLQPDLYHQPEEENVTPEPVSQVERDALAQKWREVEPMVNIITELLSATEAEKIPDALFDLISTKPLAWCRLIRAMAVIILAQSEVNARDRLAATALQGPYEQKPQAEPKIQGLPPQMQQPISAEMNQKFIEVLVRNEKFLGMRIKRLEVLARAIAVDPKDPIPTFTFNGKTLSKEQSQLIGASVAFTIQGIYSKYGRGNQS